MELLAPLRLQILALDPAVAGGAARVVELVVVPLAVRRVVDHVEGRGGEWGGAGPAHEALLVVPAREPAVGGGDGFARDGLVAALAVAFGGCRARLGGAAGGLLRLLGGVVSWLGWAADGWREGLGGVGIAVRWAAAGRWELWREVHPRLRSAVRLGEVLSGLRWAAKRCWEGLREVLNGLRWAAKGWWEWLREVLSRLRRSITWRWHRLGEVVS